MLKGKSPRKAMSDFGGPHHTGTLYLLLSPPPSLFFFFFFFFFFFLIPPPFFFFFFPFFSLSFHIPFSPSSSSSTSTLLYSYSRLRLTHPLPPPHSTNFHPELKASDGNKDFRKTRLPESPALWLHSRSVSLLALRPISRRRLPHTDDVAAFRNCPSRALSPTPPSETTHTRYPWAPSMPITE